MRDLVFQATVPPGEATSFVRPLWHCQADHNLYGWDYQQAKYTLICSDGAPAPETEVPLWGYVHWRSDGTAAELRSIAVGNDKVFGFLGPTADTSTIYFERNTLTGALTLQLPYSNLAGAFITRYDQGNVYSSVQIIGQGYGVARFLNGVPTWCKLTNAGNYLMEHWAFSFDGASLIVGSPRISGNTSKASILKLDKATGSLDWARDLDPFARNIFVCPNSTGILISAQLSSNAYLLMQLSSDGQTVLWQKETPIGAFSDNYAGYLHLDPNGVDAYFCFRSTLSQPYYLVVGKVNTTTGVIAYTKVIDPSAPGSWGSYATSWKQHVHVETDGSVVLAIAALDFAVSGAQQCFVKLSTSGTLVYAVSVESLRASSFGINSFVFSGDHLYLAGVSKGEVGTLDTNYLVKIPYSPIYSLGYYRPAFNLKTVSNIVLTDWSGSFTATSYTTSASSTSLVDGTLTAGTEQVYADSIHFIPE